MHDIASGVTLIHPPSDSLHLNTEPLHVYPLAWLSYVYLPLFSEKAFSATLHHLSPLSRETPHKLSKVPSIFLDTLLRDLFNIVPMLFQHSERDAGQYKNTLLYFNSSDCSETLFFLYSSSILFWILFKYVLKTYLHFNCRIWSVWIYSQVLLGFWTSFKYVLNINTSSKSILDTWLQFLL